MSSTTAPVTSSTRTLLGPVARSSMLCGAALLIGGTALTPSFGTDPEAYLAVFAEHPARVAWGGLAFLFGHLLLVVPMASLARLGGLAGGAAVAVAAGAVPFGALGLLRIHEVAVAVAVGPETGAAVTKEFEALPAGLIGILPGVAAVNLGLIVLAIALSRRGMLPVWAPVLVILGIAGVMTGGDGTLLGMVGSILLGAFLALVAKMSPNRSVL